MSRVQRVIWAGLLQSIHPHGQARSHSTIHRMLLYRGRTVAQMSTVMELPSWAGRLGRAVLPVISAGRPPSIRWIGPVLYPQNMESTSISTARNPALTYIAMVLISLALRTSVRHATFATPCRNESIEIHFLGRGWWSAHHPLFYVVDNGQA